MNERIRELAEQAGLQPSRQWIVSCDHEAGTFETEPCWEEFEKFAELIVRECAEAVKNSIWHLPRGYKVADQAEFVKKHFEVE